MADGVPRRDFLQLGAAAGLAASLAPGAFGQEKPRPVRLGVVGVGGRGTYLLGLALQAGVDVPALCDINPAAFARGAALVEKARDGKRPEGYTAGPKDYQRLLQRDDLDAVLIATPMQLHAAMAIDALRAGKHALSEVAAAVTLEDCWGLVRAVEDTGKLYMLAENVCYYRPLMAVLNMVRRGVFGGLTYAECGYVHDCRSLAFQGDGSLTWRGELSRDYAGNVYPTHSLGPVAQWLGIQRGDRMVSLVAMATQSKAIEDYAARRFPEGSPARTVRFKLGDSTNVLIRTAKGVLIDLRFDMFSPRPVPSTTYHHLQGLKASFDTRHGIWVDGRSKGHAWEPADAYDKEFGHEKWTRWGEEASKSGHGGADFFVIREFLDAVRAPRAGEGAPRAGKWSGGPVPIDVYDAAAWSAIIPLSGKSVAEGGAPQEIPDFTRGKWETRA